MEGRKTFGALMVLVGVGNAACLTGGWLLVRNAIDKGIKPGDTHHLTVIVVIYLGVAAVGWVLQAHLIRGLATIGQAVVIGLRRDLFDHLTSLSLRYFSQQKAGWIIARLTSDVDAVSDVLSQGMPTLVSNVILLPAAVIALLIADWRLGLIAFVVLPPTLVLSRWFQRASHSANVEQRNRIAAVTAQIAESVAGMAVVQAFNRERRFQAEFDALNDANREQSTYVQRIFSVFFPSIEFLGVLAMGTVVYFGSNLYEDGTLTIGTLITAMYLLQLVFQPLQELSDVYGQLQSAGAAMVKIASVLDEESEIHDKPGADPLPRLDGDLDIDSVVFAYGKDPVLHGISFHLEPGACFALVGESGHGKSTLARLIGRHYDPDEGAVRVDGHDLRDVQLRSYRRQLGVVLQDPFLFSGTIASNIRFAKPDATDEEVQAAAAAVGVDRVAATALGRPRPHGARGRYRALGRRAPAHLDRAGTARRPAHPRPRRGHLEHRPPDRGADRTGARPAPERPHLDHHRPPPLDGPARRRDPRRGERAGHTARLRTGAPGDGRAVPPSRPHAGRRRARAGSRRLRS